MDIRTELEKAVNIKQGTSEGAYEYTIRLAETVDREANDSIFEALSAEAKDWMNKAISSYKSRQRLPELPVNVTSVAEEPTILGVTTGRIQSETPNESNTPKVVVTKSKEEINKIAAVAVANEISPKPTKKVKVKKIVTGPSSSSDIRDIICQNYDKSLAEIEKVLLAKNIQFKSSLVRNVYAYVTSTIRTLDTLGLLKVATKGASDSAKLRELICTNTNMSVAQIQQEVINRKINCNPNTVSVIFYHVRATLKTLKTTGMID